MNPLLVLCKQQAAAEALAGMQSQTRPRGMQEARQQAGIGHVLQRPQNWLLQHGLACSQSGSEQFRMPKTMYFPNSISRGCAWENLHSFLLLLRFGALGTISASVSLLFWKVLACADMIEVN